MSSIHLKHVSVEFPIYNAKAASLRHELFKVGAGALKLSPGIEYPVVKALDSVSLDVSKGERVGLIGRNGSGKSTLLSVLGGFCYPSSGTVAISGRSHALFSVSGGMDEELTGYENIELLALLNHLTKAEAANLLPDVESFTELGHYLNFPVRTYSAGMKMRLAFAVTTSINPEILLMDEAIGAGDDAFIEKAKKRATELYERSDILVMASHSADIIGSLCNRCILLDSGK